MTSTNERLAAAGRLLRLHEAAAEAGLTPRSVRYYEEVGLLRPAARSEGDYRLYDETDLERLRFIKGLRDDAGFSLAEIAQLLEDEAARERGHAAFDATTDPAERKRILCERVASFERQIETLRAQDRSTPGHGGRDPGPSGPNVRVDRRARTEPTVRNAVGHLVKRCNWQLAFWQLVVGAGSGIFNPPNTSAVMGVVPPNKRGAGAGTRMMLMQSGFVLSIALAIGLVSASMDPKVLVAIFSGDTDR